MTNDQTLKTEETEDGEFGQDEEEPGFPAGFSGLGRSNKCGLFCSDGGPSRGAGPPRTVSV